MNDYLYLYFGGSMPSSPEEGQAMTEEWMAYFSKLGDHLVDPGAPTGETSSLGGAPASGVTGYSIISAAGLEEAIALTEDHPHLARGGSIEVLETIPMTMDDDEGEEDEDEDATVADVESIDM